jgi:hypothetical protein
MVNWGIQLEVEQEVVVMSCLLVVLAVVVVMALFQGRVAWDPLAVGKAWTVEPPEEVVVEVEMLTTVAHHLTMA